MSGVENAGKVAGEKLLHSEKLNISLEKQNRDLNEDLIQVQRERDRLRQALGIVEQKFIVIEEDLNNAEQDAATYKAQNEGLKNQVHRLELASRQ
jgi:hypothetical protein